MSKKTLKALLMCVAAALILVISVIIVAVCGKLDISPFTQVIMYICAFLLFCLAVTFIYLLYISKEREPNFFLYISKDKINMSEEKLDFATVNDRMNLYLATNFPTEKRLWTGDYLEKSNLFGKNASYKVLVIYKMLYDLSVIDTADGWECFGTAPVAVINEMSRTLTENGDERMAKMLVQLRMTYKGDYYTLRDYLIGNIRYMEGRMLGYIKKNIEEFYDD